MNNEEKLAMVKAACDLIDAAMSNVREAEKLLNKCGISICSGLNHKKFSDWDNSGCNVLLFSGIKNFEKITGMKGYNPTNYMTEKPDKSRKALIYRGVRFEQIGCERTFTFR